MYAQSSSSLAEHSTTHRRTTCLNFSTTSAPSLNQIPRRTSIYQPATSERSVQHTLSSASDLQSARIDHSELHLPRHERHGDVFDRLAVQHVQSVFWCFVPVISAVRMRIGAVSEQISSKAICCCRPQARTAFEAAARGLCGVDTPNRSNLYIPSNLKRPTS